MSPNQTKAQILLVEDSIEEVFLVRAILEQGGQYQVTTSQDGDQAARLIRETRFDLVITDLNLPGIDGYDLIRLIKKTRPDVPVLTTTGYTASHYVEHAYRAGANHVLTKPLDRDELLKRVAELVAGSGPPAPKAPVVLAIGALPGDIEWGCAGHLLACRQRGDEILLLPLRSQAGEAIEAEKRGAARLGARIIATEQPAPGAEGTKAHHMLFERIVRDLNPYLALIPSLADDDVARREAHRISRVAVADVGTVLAYETPTSNAEFHPDHFVDIARHLDRKLDALSGYLTRGRPDLDPGFVEAAARYWGKHVGFGLAEAFEALKEPEKAGT
jgi:CheY-like chemotaxis protein